MISVDEAQAELLGAVVPTDAEWVELAAAADRTLAADLLARRTQPPSDLSAMDGYAIRHADALGGTEIKVIGESAAGHGFSGKVGRGEAVRIFTGAPIPAGADTVVIQEDCERQDDKLSVTRLPAIGANVRSRGIDFTEGTAGLTAGTRLGFGALGLAAAMNHARLSVRRRPRVALIASGDELVLPGSEASPNQIVASSTVALAKLIHDAGGEAVDLGIAPDRLDALRSHIRQGIDGGADIVIVTGGASVGDHDHTRPAFEAEGADIGFWKIAMRPGKPLMHGKIGKVHVLGLPGNPVSTLVCGILFLAPLIRALQGRPDVLPMIETATLAAPLKANDFRRDFLRGRLTIVDGLLTVTAVASQDSSLLSMIAAADALIIRREHAPAAAAGDRVEIIRI